jgi:hypothetical protein
MFVCLFVCLVLLDVMVKWLLTFEQSCPNKVCDDGGKEDKDEDEEEAVNVAQIGSELEEWGLSLRCGS